MSYDNKRTCRLTEAGIEKWKASNIEPDPRQVFTIEYEAKDHLWVKVWWGESKIMTHEDINEVFWCEEVCEYV